MASACSLNSAQSGNLDIYFCDRVRSPWQRGTNEHLTVSLRHILQPSGGTDLHRHSRQRPRPVAAALKLCRPRKTLGWTGLQPRPSNEYLEDSLKQGSRLQRPLEPGQDVAIVDLSTGSVTHEPVTPQLALN